MSKKGKKEKKAKQKTLLNGSNGEEAVEVHPIYKVASLAAEGQIHIKNKTYEKELARLQVELVRLQEWIRAQKLKVVAVFEGRDAAGKGGVIKRITESLTPVSAAWWRWGRPPSGKRLNGISSGTAVCIT